MEYLMEWCKYQNLRVVKNNEVFFVNERVLIKPRYIINGNIFVETPDEYEITETYLSIRQLFSKTYGTIIIIPNILLVNMMDITKFDIQKKFNIRF